MRYKVGFIGLGKLGLPCAEVMGRTHSVYGFDPITKPTQNVRRVNVMAEAVEGMDFVFIAVPTPHEQEYDGSIPTSRLPARDFNYTILKSVLTEIAQYVRPAHNIVIISTVLPGTCRRELAPLLPSGKLIYNPYFIAMGTVERDFLAPEFVVIGSDVGNEGDSAALIDFYETFLREPRFHTGTWEEAEATKIFYNTFISFKLSFVNMIQDVALRLGHLNVDKVTTALSGAKQRIFSDMYMKAGMGDGGPCHPRDNIALRALAEHLDLGYDLFSAILRCREGQAENMARFLLKFGNPVIIMGKSFKPGVPYVDGSYSLLVAHYVGQAGRFAGFIDSLTGDNVDEEEPLTYLLAHGGSAFHGHQFFPRSVIVDPWRECPEIERCQVIHYGNGQPIENLQNV
jgi:UDPglucose 6-dehydrogenase